MHKNYEKMIQKEKRDLYSGKRIQIPSPRFVVFYNGLEEQPEKKILRLWESFYRQTEETGLELTVLQVREEGREEGAAWGRGRLLAGMLERGLSAEEISELTGEPVETIREAVSWGDR